MDKPIGIWRIREDITAMKFLQSDPQCMETGFIPVLTWIAEQVQEDREWLEKHNRVSKRCETITKDLTYV